MAKEPAPKTAEAKGAFIETYRLEDFVQAHKAMGARPEVIRAALSETGRVQFTEKEARDIISAFLKREVI